MAVLSGCGSSSSSDTQTAVRQATVLKLTAQIVAPANGSTLFFDPAGEIKNVEISFTVSDGVPPYGWTVTVTGIQGVVGTAAGALETGGDDQATIDFAEEGAYTIALTVNDANGNTANDSIVARVAFDPNDFIVVAQITSPGGDLTINAGDSITFQGQGLFGTEDYKFAWAIPGGSVTSSTDDTVSGVVFATPGVYTVSFTVSDANGLSDTDTVLITVR
jgi:hypothetical protein